MSAESDFDPINNAARDATHDQADAMWVLQCGLDSLHGRVVEEKSDDAWR